MSSELIRLLGGLAISIAVLMSLNRVANLHPFFCLLISSILLGLIVGSPLHKILITMQTGFGSLLQQIGFIVALGSCLGVMMERTGAMHVVSEKIVTAFGRSRSATAMTTVGLLVGIPVFCDSGFIILSRLIPALASQSSASASTLTLALSTGLFTTHSLVPPTPGPLAAAVNLGLGEQMGIVMVVSILASIPVGLVAYVLSMRFGKNIRADLSQHQSLQPTHRISTFFAFTPLALPIVLITLSTLPNMLAWRGIVSQVLLVLGNPAIALAMGLLFTIPLIAKHQRRESSAWVTTALVDAGIILLITGAGGAFGNVIRESGLEPLLREHLANVKSAGVSFLIAAFGIGALLKSAGGSTTSSMIITSALLAPLAPGAGFTDPVELCALTLSIGSGGMCVSHANDSYFWVISQFGGLQPRDAMRSYTLITSMQGLTGLAVAITLLSIWRMF